MCACDHGWAGHVTEGWSGLFGEAGEGFGGERGEDHHGDRPVFCDGPGHAVGAEQAGVGCDRAGARGAAE